MSDNVQNETTSLPRTLPHYSTKLAVFMLSLKDLLEKGEGHAYPNDIQINHD